MLGTRLGTAAVALPAVLAAIIFLPNTLFSLFIFVLGLWGLYEVGAMTRAESARARVTLIVVGGLPLIALLDAIDPSSIPAVVVLMVMLAMVARVAVGGPAAGLKGVGLNAVGAAFVGVLFPYFALLRNRPGGVEAVVLVLLLVVASDTGAYFVGRQWGRVKLAPRVSPSKTVEGAIGGIVAAGVTGMVLGPKLTAWSVEKTLLASGFIGALAIVGDLAGSALKRSAGVKDSGWIFPGHGGLVDRTCSLVFAAVFTYYYWA